MKVPLDNPFEWFVDWAWSIPLILLNVVIHIVGLGFLGSKAIRVSGETVRKRPMTALVVVAGATTLLATVLHGIEAGIWAGAYLMLGAFHDYKSSMLFSLNAITSFGHTDLSLQQQWQLMGALEALNGWLLFGLTTAFLFAAIQAVWLAGMRQRHELLPASERPPVPEDAIATERRSTHRPIEYPR